MCHLSQPPCPKLKTWTWYHRRPPWCRRLICTPYSLSLTREQHKTWTRSDIARTDCRELLSNHPKAILAGWRARFTNYLLRPTESRHYYCGPSGAPRPSPYPEMWSGGGRVPKALEWRRRRRWRGLGLGSGCAPSQKFFLACSPSKWCILMHSAAHFRPNIIATMMFMGLITRSQAVARIADHTAKNCRSHVT